MSRPKKIHKPIAQSFGNILVAVATGSGKGKAAAVKLARKNKAKKSGQNKAD
jgi:Tfp pilus assembly pilus retraction ATPase PilT